MSGVIDFSVLFFTFDSFIFETFQKNYALTKTFLFEHEIYELEIGGKKTYFYYHAEQNICDDTLSKDLESFEQVFYIGNGEIAHNTDIQSGDICIPNTLIFSEDTTLFFEKFVGDNYDLQKFGVLLNGICSTFREDSEEFFCDILDPKFLKFGIANIQSVSKKLTLIHGVELTKENNKNLFPILEFILN